MKTIEISKNQFTFKEAYMLLRFLYHKELKLDNSFHFLFEPNLIIRTNRVKNVRKWLDKSGWKYKVYAYPYSKKGYGESKKHKESQSALLYLLHLQSLVALSRNKKEKFYMLNRMHHCFLNMLAFEYYDESKYYLGQAKNYMYLDYKAEGKPAFWLLYKLISFVYKLT